MSSYQTYRVRIEGIAPLLMSNGQMIDPLNEHAKKLKEVTKGNKKHLPANIQLATQHEFFGRIYVDEDGEPCLTGEMIEATLVKGAKKTKDGNDAKSGILVDTNSKLIYDGSKDPKEMVKDSRFLLRVPVKVGMARVMRTRPKFDKWAADLEIKHIPTIVPADKVREFLVTAGLESGIGDWRPRCGRFIVVD